MLVQIPKTLCPLMKIIITRVFLALVFALCFALSSRAAVPLPWYKQLDEWHFNSYSLLTVHTSSPQAALGFTLAPDWNTNALRMVGTEFGLVQYPIVTTSGLTNLVCDFGSVRFWYRPLWSSATTSLNGTGPGTSARLLEVGLWTSSATYGWWCIYLNPQGTNLSFGGQADHHSVTYARAPIEWQSNRWYQIAVAYSQSNSFIYVDGKLAAEGSGVTRFPNAAVQAQTGLNIGSTSLGEKLMQGDMDVLQTFNYQLDYSAITNGYWDANPVESSGSQGSSGGGSPGPSGGGSGGGSSGGNTNPPSGLAPAYAGLTNSTNLWIEIRSGTNHFATLLLHNTQPTTNYQILSRTSLGTNSNWFVLEDLLGAENTNCTVTTVDTTLLPSQFLAFGVSEDSDGDGLPDVYELLATFTSVTNADTGDTGIPDGYKDPDGDGWTNLDELRNGTNPLQFNTPAPPPNIQVHYAPGRTNVTITWEPTRGPVTGYIVRDHRGNVVAALGSDVFQVSDNSDLLDFWPWLEPSYSVQAVYAGGVCEAMTSMPPGDPRLAIEPYLLRGAGGSPYLVVTGLKEEIDAISVIWSDGIGEATHSVYVARTNFSNGCYKVPNELFPMSNRVLWAQGVTTGGSYGLLVLLRRTQAESWGRANVPFAAYVDIRQLLSDNLRFLIRGATATQRFSYAAYQGDRRLWSRGVASPQYEYSGYHWYYPNSEFGSVEFDFTRPLDENFLWRNFVFDANLFTSGGVFLTGARPELNAPGGGPEVVNPLFQNFLTNTTSQLPTNQAVGIYRTHLVGFTNGFNDEHLLDLGMAESQSGDYVYWSLRSPVTNWWGLPIDSLQIASGSPVQFPIVSAGQPADVTSSAANIFLNARQPIFAANEHYFTKPDPNNDGLTFLPPIPGEPTFSPTNTTPVFITGVGQQIQLSGWAKKRILNGDTNKFAYLEQFFDKAFKADANGNATTNETGILSEYGEFFPTEPGRVILTTKPDIETAEVGHAIINVIHLGLDVNHDGEMNLTFGGPDSTSAQRPFVFWVNNDYDRGHKVDCNIIGLDCDWEEDDLGPDEVAKLPGEQRFRDSHFQTNGLNAIPSQRDLEDYARLWIPNLPSLLGNLPTNYTARLALDGNAAIRIFRSLETNGGTNYLFQEGTASNQVRNSSALYLGRLNSSFPITLSGHTNLGEHFIFCGTQRGSGGIHLQILDGQTVVAERVVHIELKDVKEMYERWTVGDAPTALPLPKARLASEDLPQGPPAFSYAHNGGSDTNEPYILYVHGWNLERWEKDRFAEAMFKRLYWQGYQGRFGLFRWPTHNKFDAYNWSGSNPVSDPNNYDNSELQGWLSGRGLRQLLADLNAQYPEQVRVAAHSMGNVVAGEALRTNTPLVAVYAALQAALPSRAYDSNATYRAIPGAANDNTPELYRDYCGFAPTKPYFHLAAGAALYVNFYNPVDYALDKWTLDQNLKPAGTLNYSYVAATSTFYRFRNQTGQQILACPTNSFELFSYCVEGQCYALGAQAGVDGAFTSQAEVLLDPTFAFGGLHKGHSAEFRSTNMKRSAFWEQFSQAIRIK